MSREIEKAQAMGGLAVTCGMVSGFACFIVAIFSVFSYNWVGAGVCLGSAGLSFGLVENAVWRR